MPRKTKQETDIENIAKPKRITRTKKVVIQEPPQITEFKEEDVPEAILELSKADEIRAELTLPPVPKGDIQVYLYVKFESNKKEVARIPDFMKFIKEFQKLLSNNQMASMVFVNTQNRSDIVGYQIANMFMDNISDPNFNWRHRTLNNECKKINLLDIGKYTPQQMFEIIQELPEFSDGYFVYEGLKQQF